MGARGVPSNPGRSRVRFGSKVRAGWGLRAAAARCHPPLIWPHNGAGWPARGTKRACDG